MEFDSAISSFLALLVNKLYRKKSKLQTEVFNFEVTKFKTIFCLESSFVLEIMENFNKIWNLAKVQDINILRNMSLSQETMQYPCFKPERVSPAQRSIHLEHDKHFPKILKITRTGVINKC